MYTNVEKVVQLSEERMQLLRVIQAAQAQQKPVHGQPGMIQLGSIQFASPYGSNFNTTSLPAPLRQEVERKILDLTVDSLVEELRKVDAELERLDALLAEPPVDPEESEVPVEPVYPAEDDVTEGEE